MDGAGAVACPPATVPAEADAPPITIGAQTRMRAARIPVAYILAFRNVLIVGLLCGIE